MDPNGILQRIAGHVLFAESGCKGKRWPEQAEILGQGQAFGRKMKEMMSQGSLY